jgi:flagellar biosynthesis/type III secretory pathway chaperone
MSHPTATAAVTSLIRLLEQEEEQLTALLNLLRDEQQAIKTLSSHGLQAVTAAKLHTLESLKTLEGERLLAVRHLADAWGGDEHDLTLRAIAERIPAAEAGRLLRLRDRLARTLAAVHEASDFNRTLIDQSLATIRQGLTAWQRTDVSPLYASDGTLQRSWSAERPLVAVTE